MDLPDYPPEWYDVGFGIQSGYLDGYRVGHRDGHLAGWEAGIRSAAAQDLEFARMVERELHRRELHGESARDLVKRLLDALRTEENRRHYPDQFQPARRAA